MGNPVMQWQILTKQPKKLEEFYSKVFGWEVSNDNPLGYMRVDTGSKEGIHGGFWPIGEKEGHSMVQLFIRVPDVNAHVKKAEQLGARIVIPPQMLPTEMKWRWWWTRTGFHLRCFEDQSWRADFLLCEWIVKLLAWGFFAGADDPGDDLADGNYVAFASFQAGENAVGG